MEDGHVEERSATVPQNWVGPTTLELGQIEAKAAASLFSGDVRLAVEAVQTLAAELLGSNGHLRRKELVAVHLATTHVQASALEALLGTLLKAKNEEGVLLVTSMLKEATSRLVRLAQAHAIEAGREQRPVLLVAHADQVTVGAAT